MVAETVLDEVRLYRGAAAGGATDESRLRCLAACAAEHLAAKHPAELSPGELRASHWPARPGADRGGSQCAAARTAELPTWTGNPPPRSAAPSLRCVDRSPSCWWHTTGQTRELADDLVAVLPGAAPTSTVEALPLPVPASLPKPLLPPGRQPWHPCRFARRSRWRLRHQGRRQIHSRIVQDPRQADRQPGHRRRKPAGRRPGPPEAPPAVQRRPSSAGFLAPVDHVTRAAGAVGTLAALFAVALAGLSGWLIIRASEQPPILYLLTAIVGVRFFGIGRAAPALPRTPPAARRRLCSSDPAPRPALGNR